MKIYFKMLIKKYINDKYTLRILHFGSSSAREYKPARTERQADIETERQADTETERQADTETERQADTETERPINKILYEKRK